VVRGFVVVREGQLLEQQPSAPQQLAPSADESRFFSSGTGWRVWGAEADEVDMSPC